MTNLVWLAALLVIWPFGSGKEYRMNAGSQVPAATGTVKVTRDKDNGNTAFDIKVEHLAKPSTLTPPAGAYLVWIQPRGDDAVKQGALGINDDLKGELKGVTVSKDFELIITAEQSEMAQRPSGQTVLRVRINQT